jgi:uncharacterized protein (TIGR03067 family)
MVRLLSQDDTLKDALTRKDLQRLQGAWEFVAGSRRARLSIDDDRFQIEFANGDLYAGFFQLDPTRKLKAIDLSLDEAPERHRGKVVLGVYLLDGHLLVICPGVPGSGQRPDSFPEPGDRERMRLVFRKG